MITKQPLTKADYKKIENDYMISGYYPPGFTLWGVKDSITKPIGGKTYILRVDPKGDIPICWVSGLITNDENPYAAYVSDVNNNPKYTDGFKAKKII